MKIPTGITNEPQWVNRCCQIRARALELMEGRIRLWDAAVALAKLAQWTRATEDPDLNVFMNFRNAMVGLPVGPEREHWRSEALAREDIKIRAIEGGWRPAALEAAAHLVERYAWSLDRRAELRSLARAGTPVRVKRGPPGAP
jgi:hypothetical protein